MENMQLINDNTLSLKEKALYLTLKLHPTMSQADLKSLSDDGNTCISSTLHKLIKKNYIERIPVRMENGRANGITTIFIK